MVKIKPRFAIMSNFPTFLFVSEDEIDPLVNLARDELRLQRLPVDPHELVRGRRPRRQLHVVHLGPIVQLAEPVPGVVDEHLGQVVELGDELLHVARVPLTVGPGALHAAEQSVGVIKLPALQREEQGGEGLQPDQPVQGEGSRAVVCAVVKRRYLIMLPRGVSKMWILNVIQGQNVGRREIKVV